MILLLSLLIVGLCRCSIFVIHNDQQEPSSLLQASNISSSEISALQSLYNATDGDDWVWQPTGGIPWLFGTGADPCMDDWQGIACDNDGTTAHIVSIVLTSHNLNGSIPSDISALTMLSVLQLDHNYLTNSIPYSLGELPVLVKLQVGTNHLQGTIPAALCDAQSLTVLQLYDNQLNGTIPSCLSDLAELVDLDVNTNLLTGYIPPEFGNFLQLRYLYVNNNSLSGPIPDSLGNLDKVQTLFLSNNSLTGTIPAELGNISTLVFLSLYNNSLRGTIPASLGHLGHLQGLNFDVNQLTGSIPAELGNLQSLLFFNLHANLLTGSFPHQVGNIAALQYLDMHNNSLTGTLPPQLGNNTELTYMDFSFNHIRGSIPSTIGKLNKLLFLTLEDNMLTGVIPTAIATLPSLYILLLQNNYLSGPCNEIADPVLQVNLTTIQLSNNQLSGPFPTALFQLPSLTTFASVSNCFTGTLSDSICQGTALRTLALDGMRSATSCQVKLVPAISDAYVVKYVFHHNIFGPLPTCLLKLPHLMTLHVSGNGLTGSIPSDVAISPSLLDLSLSHNSLTGYVPTTIQSKQWYDLDLSYNNFGGELDDSFAGYAANASVRLNNNKLSGPIPGKLQDVHNISVLQGNLFSCDLDRADLPQNDPNADTYSCGSDSFNLLYFTWLGFTFAMAVIVTVLWRYRLQIDAYVNLSDTYVYIARCMNVQKELMNTSKEANLKLQALRYVLDLGDALCKVSLILTVVLVLILMPVYTAFSAYYSTHAHTYAWRVSLSYTAGAPAMGTYLCVFLLLMTVFVCTFVTYTKRCSIHRRQRRMRISQTLETAAVPQMPWWKRSMYCACIMVVVISVVLGVNVAFVFVTLYESFAVLTLAQILLSIFKLGWNNALSPTLKKWTTKHLITSRLDYMSMQLFVALFNNISIPCLVVAIISPDCFYTLFVAAAPVVSQYSFEECGSYSQAGCIGTAVQVATTSYAPPFAYSFQCSAGLLSYYVPVFVYLCIIATFVEPFLQLASYQLYVRYRGHSTARYVLEQFVATAFSSLHDIQERERGQCSSDHGAHPSIDNAIVTASDADSTTSATIAPGINPRQSSQSQSNTDVSVKEVVLNTTGSVSYFDAAQYITALLAYMGLLLTFGAVYPPLAAAVLVTMYATAFSAKLKVGHTLCLSQTVHQHDCCDILAMDCSGVGSALMMHRAMWTIAAFAFAFYTQFLFDTLGYDTGARGAVWVIVVTPMIGFCMYFVYFGTVLRNKLAQQRSAPDGNIELNELSASGGADESPDVERDGSVLTEDSDVYNVMQA